MKRPILLPLALGAALLTAGSIFGQNKSGNIAVPAGAAAPAAAAPKAQKLVKIATLNGAEANREFQNNVQLVQAQRQAAVELNAKWEQEKDAKKKAELKSQLDQLLTKLNENNNAMQKAYGFSLTRNYTMEIVSANIYMFVTDEEAAALEKAQKEEAQKAAATKKK
jgi:hypothetical protein